MTLIREQLSIPLNSHMKATGLVIGNTDAANFSLFAPGALNAALTVEPLAQKIAESGNELIALVNAPGSVPENQSPESTDYSQANTTRYYQEFMYQALKLARKLPRLHLVGFSYGANALGLLDSGVIDTVSSITFMSFGVTPTPERDEEVPKFLDQLVGATYQPAEDFGGFLGKIGFLLPDNASRLDELRPVVRAVVEEGETWQGVNLNRFRHRRIPSLHIRGEIDRQMATSMEEDAKFLSPRALLITITNGEHDAPLRKRNLDIVVPAIMELHSR